MWLGRLWCFFVISLINWFQNEIGRAFYNFWVFWSTVGHQGGTPRTPRRPKWKHTLSISRSGIWTQVSNIYGQILSLWARKSFGKLRISVHVSMCFVTFWGFFMCFVSKCWPHWSSPEFTGVHRSSPEFTGIDPRVNSGIYWNQPLWHQRAIHYVIFVVFHCFCGEDHEITHCYEKY